MKKSVASFPNDSGRLPLHLAAARGTFLEEGLCTIFQAAPRALSTRDTVTHMHPFMLAASADSRDEGFLPRFSTCFHLLSCNPALIGLGGNATRDEVMIPVSINL